MSAESLSLTLKIWRQSGPAAKGRFVTYPMNDVSPDMSFLEMIRELNRDLIVKGEEPVAIDYDCMEGICGTCGVMINGRAHGPLNNVTTCQLHMRHFHDGDTLVIEPFRSAAFPIVKDLVVDRAAFDRIIRKGGYVSVGTGQAPEANSVAVAQDVAEEAMDAAACIGCGACVAQCVNGAAMLFTSAKISQLALMPQGHAERAKRALSMVGQMRAEGFGNCVNESECQLACPKNISVANIQRMNREYLKASLTAKR